jgi:hypothetical protein
LQFCWFGDRAALFPLEVPPASSWSMAVSVTVESLPTIDTARCVIPVAGVTPSAPLCAKNPTRRPPSAGAVIAGPWMTTEFRANRPELSATGETEPTPE